MNTKYKCDCPPGAERHLTTPFCTDCDTAVLEASLISSLDYINVELKFDAKFSVDNTWTAEQTCSNTLESTTLKLLGEGP